MRPIRAALTTVLTFAIVVFGLPGLSGDVGPSVAKADPPPNPLSITTWAGSGANETVDGTGTSASFTSMGGVVVSGGFAYVATDGSIRKVNLSTQQVTTLAGHATERGCIDNSDPSQVRFELITDIDTDGTYLYTTGNCGTGTRLRKTSLATGETTELLGNVGVGHLTVAPNGMIYSSGGQGIEEIDPDTGEWSEFAWLSGNGYAITSDSTHIYLAWVPNTGGVVIDRFTYQGDQTSFSSAPETGLTTLESVDQYLYGVGNGSRIRRYLKADASYATLAGAGPSGYENGTGTDAWFNNITGIAPDGTALFISDDINNRLRKGVEGSPLPFAQPESVTTDLGINPAAVDTTAGNGQNATVDETGELASFTTMGGLVVVDGFAYIATTGAIRKVDLATREVSTFAGHPSERDCTDSTDRFQVRFRDVSDIDTDGHYLYTANQCGFVGRIRRTSLATGATSTVHSDFGLYSLTVGPDGMIYASGGQGVDKIDPVEGTATEFDWLIGQGWTITSDATHIWLAWIPAASGVPQIDKYTLDGTATPFASDAGGMTGIESAGKYLYSVGDGLSTLRVYDKSTGAWANIAGGTRGYEDGTGADAEFAQISGIASDGDNLWISDQENYRLRKAVQGQQASSLFGSCGSGTYTSVSCSMQSDPVNTATGNFYHHVTDARLPGIGVPWEFARHYNSLDPTTGPFGEGWSHSYNTSLSIDQNGDAVLRTEDGKQVPFTLQEDGSFWGGPGARSTLDAIQDGYELVTHDLLHYVFDTQGRLMSLEDRNGQGLSFTYQGVQLDSIVDSVGRQIDLQYQGDLLSSVVLPGGRHVDYGYSGGQLTTVTDLRGGTTTYTYDGQGWMDTVVDQNQQTVVDNTYGPEGRITQQIDAMGEEGIFDWDPETETSTFTDAMGKTWTDDYDNGVLVSQTDPLGNTTTYGYSGPNPPTSITDPRGNTITLRYDDRGNLLEREAPAPLSYEESFTYDSLNNLTSHTDGRDHTTSYEYDASGNLVEITQPGNIVTEFGRDPATGLLTSVTDPRDKTTTFDHDAQGNLNEVVTPSLDLTTMGYDTSGRMTTRVEARGTEPGANPTDFTWIYTYDDADHLLTQADPLDNQTEWVYDPAGNLDSVTDANEHTTEYGYNAANELTSVTAPDDTVTSYDYDEVGNVTSRTDAETHVTEYEYDDARRLIEVESPIGQRWAYEYDASGNVNKVITARGMATPAPGDGAITYTYDELNRLTGIDYSEATPDVGLEYDPNGNRTEMTDGSGTVTYAWDSLDRLTSVTRGADTFSYVYDPAGNVTRRTYPDATAVDYTYNDNGQPSTVVTGGTTTSYSYDPAGQLTQTTLPSGNGHKETRIYDQAGRVTEVKNAKGQTILSKFTYTLDAVGNPTQVVTPTGATTNQYDELDRLTEVCFQASCPLPADPFIRWVYDGVGNRTSEDRPAGTTTYSYNDADQLTSRTGPGGTMNYTYDDDGNQTVAGSRTFAYDLAHRLTSTTSGSATTTYTYDGDGRRLLASTGVQASQKTRYLWDSNWTLFQLALERNGAGTLRRRYVHGNDLISMFTGGKAYYYHYDALGSTANLTSNTGAKQWTYAYEAFGSIRTETKNNANAPVNLMRFTGELFDTDTGLYHLRARQYDSGTARFGSVDPIGARLHEPFAATYVYANNRATVLIDPSGLRGEMTWWEDLALNPIDVWQAGLPKECNTPGYIDINVSALFFSTGVYIDGCGQLIVYEGVGLGTPGFSLTQSEAFVSCDSTSVQGFLPGLVGGAGGRGVDSRDRSGFFTEHGAGIPGLGMFRNQTLGC